MFINSMFTNSSFIDPVTVIVLTKLNTQQGCPDVLFAHEMALSPCNWCCHGDQCL